MSVEATKERTPVSVEVDAVSKGYGGQTVLKEISFNVSPGETFVIMGPSGAGKSVLLRQIIGLEKPDSGEVRISGMPAHEPATHKTHKTALVFQAGALFNSMTVYENLALYPREHRLYDEATIREKVMSALKALSIEDAVRKIPAELSGGMRKRVSVARAIVMEPELILYDEPTSELDPVMAAGTAELIATVGEELGITSIVITHDRQLSMGIADRVAVLMEGTIRFVGSREELKACDKPDIREFLNPSIDLKNPRFRKQESPI